MKIFPYKIYKELSTLYGNGMGGKQNRSGEKLSREKKKKKKNERVSKHASLSFSLELSQWVAIKKPLPGLNQVPLHREKGDVFNENERMKNQSPCVVSLGRYFFPSVSVCVSICLSLIHARTH